MLNISGIHEGFVLDHIQAGMSLQIYHDLKLDQLDCPVAIIKNAKSSKMGKKDILKVECPIDALDFDILGFIDHNITVNVIQNDKIVSKKELRLPKQVKNVIKCKNPRCITSIEQELDQIFILTDPEKEVYRCKYCDCLLYTSPSPRDLKLSRMPSDASARIWMEELDHLDDEPKQAAGGFLGGSWEAFAAQMSRQ